MLRPLPTYLRSNEHAMERGVEDSLQMGMVAGRHSFWFVAVVMSSQQALAAHSGVSTYRPRSADSIWPLGLCILVSCSVASSRSSSLELIRLL
jgi:hypothetical protein